MHIAMLWIKLTAGLALLVSALVVDNIDPLLVLLLSLPFLSSAFQVLTYKKWSRDSKFSWMAGMGLLDTLIGAGTGIFAYAAYGAMAVVATLTVASQATVEMHLPWPTTVAVAIIFTLASIVNTVSAFKRTHIEQRDMDREKI